jgi:hypothetical protein
MGAAGRGRLLMRRRYITVVAVLGLFVALVATPAMAINNGNMPSRTMPLYQTVNGCEEDVYVTGTRTVASEYRLVNDENERYRYIVTWDATGVGRTTGAEYKVTYSFHAEGIGWPPLTPPTNNVVAYQSTLRLDSEVAGKEIHRINSHRVLHSGHGNGPGKNTGMFYKVTDSC